MPRVRVADDRGVARGDRLVRAEGADDPAPGLGAGAHEVAEVRHVEAAGHLAVGDHEVHAWARACDSGEGAGSMAGLGFDVGHSVLLGVPGLRNGVVVKLALGREKHLLPLLRAEPAVMEVKVAKHEELLLAALREVWALDA